MKDRDKHKNKDKKCDKKGKERQGVIDKEKGEGRLSVGPNMMLRKGGCLE